MRNLVVHVVVTITFKLSLHDIRYPTRPNIHVHGCREADDSDCSIIQPKQRLPPELFGLRFATTGSQRDQPDYNFRIVLLLITFLLLQLS